MNCRHAKVSYCGNCSGRVRNMAQRTGEIFVGDLQAEGKATWTCDSTSQWAWRGEDKDFQYLIDQWKEQRRTY